MSILNNLKPGKRENAYIVEADFPNDKTGVPSSKNRTFFIYRWDPAQQKHVRQLVINNAAILMS